MTPFLQTVMAGIGRGTRTRQSELVATLLAYAMGVALIALSNLAMAGPYSCPDTKAVVAAQRPDEALAACEGIQAGLRYMAGLGFATDLSVSVETIDRFENTDACALLGQFEAANGRIRVLGWQEAKACAQPSALGGDMTPELWRSYVSHEVAHAVAHHNSRGTPLGTAAHEYIAAVVQLGTLAPQARRSMIEHFNTEGFERPDQITELFYSFNPGLFAVKSYLHFEAHGHGMDTLRMVVAGSDNAGVLSAAYQGSAHP